MNNWKMKLYRFMQGRYGNDEFSQFLMIAGIIVIFASNLLGIGLLHSLGWIMLFYAYFRVMSKSISKRQQENYKFLQMKSKLLSRKPAGNMNANNWQQNQTTGSAGKSSWKQKRAQKKAAKQQQANFGQYQQQADVENYNYYRCRNCGQIVRVPKGKGTVKITCPECKNTFTDRT